jgi:hypothetical protein
LLRAERIDESVWDELYQSALALSEPFVIVENMQRRCGRQTTRANHSADTPKQYWKVSLYFAFIDHMIMELESRLIKSENRFYSQYLLPRVIGNITNEQIRTYVFNRRSTLNDHSAVALVTGIVKMIHKMVSIEGYSTGFTASSVSQSEVGI